MRRNTGIGAEKDLHTGFVSLRESGLDLRADLQRLGTHERGEEIRILRLFVYPAPGGR